MPSKGFEVTYSSWPLDWHWREDESRDRLSTLAIFYDKVFLPAPIGMDEYTTPKSWSYDEWIERLPAGGSKGKTIGQAEASVVMTVGLGSFEDWRNKNRSLFDANVLEFLPIPDKITDDLSDELKRQVWSKLNESSPQKYRQIPEVPSTVFAHFDGTLAFAVHTVCGRSEGREIYLPDNNDRSTERLTGLLAISLFQHYVPVLRSLTAEQILEVREYVQDTREGFTDYLAGFADELEQRLAHGTRSDLEEAGEMVKRRLRAEYNTFRRQIRSKRGKFWANVLDTGAKALRIDATPCTPKFYGEILDLALGLTGSSLERIAEQQSTKNQAMLFLGSLEKSVARQAE